MAFADWFKTKTECGGENREDPSSWDDPEIRDEPYLDHSDFDLTRQEAIAKDIQIKKNMVGE